MPNPNNPDEAECPVCYDTGYLPGTYRPCPNCRDTEFTYTPTHRSVRDGSEAMFVNYSVVTDTLTLMNEDGYEWVDPGSQWVLIDPPAQSDETAQTHREVAESMTALWQAERQRAENLQMQYEASQGAMSDLLTEHRELVEAIEALADEWAGDPVGGDLWRSEAVDALRAVLVTPPGQP